MEAKNRILLVCKRVGSASCSAQFLEKCNLEQTTTGTLQEARQRLRSGRFDFVLAEPELPDGNGMDLKEAVQAAQTSLFVSFPVRDGCWWLPVVAGGRDCMGRPALRPAEMVSLLVGDSPAETAPQSATSAAQAAAMGK